jgi:hypothetical protein
MDFPINDLMDENACYQFVAVHTLGLKIADEDAKSVS